MLAERSIEIEAMRGWLADTVAGRGTVAVISGPVASGKTELQRVLTELARKAGMTVLHAQCAVEERGLRLGLVQQLLGSALALPGGVTEPLSRNGFDDSGAVPPVPPEAGQLTAHDIYAGLRRLAGRSPVLLSIDDVQHADEPSLWILLYLTRRIRSAKIMIVLSGWSSPRLDRPLFYTELLRQPHCHRIQLPFLSEAGVRQLMTDRLDRPVGDGLVAQYHASTGGSPLFVHALIDDLLATGQPGEVPRLVAGDAYARAVTMCLYRSGPLLARAAAVLAMVDGVQVDGVLDRMFAAEPMTAGEAIRLLESAGIAESGVFRHPAARAAILADLDAVTRAQLNLRAAAVLYKKNRPLLDVAHHILAAGHADEPWQLTALQEAVDAALNRGDNKLAIDCLELASAGCDDDQVRNRLAMARADINRRLNPAAALRDILPLRPALKDGSLDYHHALEVIRYLLRSGRIAEAEEGLAALKPPNGVDAATEYYIFGTWLASTYPQVRQVLSIEPDRPRDGPPVASTITADPLLHAVDLLAGVLRSEIGPERLSDAEEAMQSFPFTEATAEAASTIVAALIYADRVGTAEALCDRFLDETRETVAPMLCGIVYNLKAQIAIRHGDLRSTVDYANQALAVMSPQSWGVGIGVPLGWLLRASSIAGDLETAEKAFAHPVPESLFQTRFGLHYRHARGIYYLATDRPQAALREFLCCGALMARWDVDVPTLAPWRLDAARAYLELGKTEAAAKLIDEQAGIASAMSPRITGMVRRLRAALAPLEERIGLLQAAAELIETSGDSLELTYVLVDQAWALGAVGEVDAAREVAARASRLIDTSGAESVRGLLIADRDLASGPAPESLLGIEALTDAEWRVAVLAARGYTNRQVACSLYITISTVEQHLTRVYRKLNIARRRDLPRWLADLGKVPQPPEALRLIRIRQIMNLVR